LAFVVTEPAKGERRARHIWIYEKQSALGPGSSHSRQVRILAALVTWTANNWLSFPTVTNSSRSTPCAQDGGEPAHLTKGKRGVKNFGMASRWQADRFLAPDAKTEGKKKGKDKDDAHVVDKEDRTRPPVALLLSTLEKLKRSPNQMDTAEAVWHPSGTGLMA